MTMQKRNVTGKVYWADGTVAAGAMVIFDLESGALSGADFVLPKQVSVAASYLGVFSAGLWCNEEGQPDVLWKATFPTGEQVYFSLPSGTTDIALSSLLSYPAALNPTDDTTWEKQKDAVRFYSLYRPRLVYEAMAPTAGSVEQRVPAGTFGVKRLSYGTEVAYDELMDAVFNVSVIELWAYNQEKLYLSPAPATAAPIAVVWKKFHLPDETSRTHPTVPAKDKWIVDLLVASEIADEEQAAVEMGLSGYSIGGTSIRWAQQGGASSTGTTRAARLRARAIAALEEPLAEWG